MDNLTYCDSPVCRMVGGPAPLATSAFSTPWSSHACSAQCLRWVGSASFSQPVTVPALVVSAQFRVVDAGGGVSTTFWVNQETPSALSLDGVPLPPPEGACDADVLVAGLSTACSAELPVAQWSFSLSRVTTLAYLPATSQRSAAAACASSAAGLQGEFPSNFSVALDPEEGALNVSVTPGAGAAAAEVWLCVVLRATRSAPNTSAGAPFPSFNSRTAAALFDANGTAVPSVHGLWSPYQPMWSDGTSLSPACAASSACSAGYPYGGAGGPMPSAPAQNPIVVAFPPLTWAPPRSPASPASPGSPGSPPGQLAAPSPPPAGSARSAGQVAAQPPSPASRSSSWLPVALGVGVPASVVLLLVACLCLRSSSPLPGPPQAARGRGVAVGMRGVSKLKL
jgi:hypothetical protein